MNAFRSQIMQQFAASARSQSRPPLALIGWLADEEGSSSGSSGGRPDIKSPTRQGSASRFLSGIPSSQSRALSSIHSTSSVSPTVSSPVSELRMKAKVTTRRSLSSLPESHDSLLAWAAPEDKGKKVDGDDLERQLSDLFQNLLRTRRTRNHFSQLPPSMAPGNDAAELFGRSYWMNALERAVECGYNAPNHKRTEPFTFKRMIAPSAKTRRLAEIAYNVKLRQQQQSAVMLSEKAILENAEKKRTKWANIPAFLVTVVNSQEVVVDPDHGEDALSSPYDLLNYVPPSSERALEDYASSCAAVQNVLLSLHSEQIATKWVTGPVIRTPAFRDLVEASPHDRIVALIMIGHPDDSKRSHARRRRRTLRGDVLVDL